MFYIYLLVGVVVIFAIMYFIDKSTFISWLIKTIEIVIVAALSLGAAYLIGSMLSEATLGIIAVGIVFYFFGGLLRPYINKLTDKIAKYLESTK